MALCHAQAKCPVCDHEEEVQNSDRDEMSRGSETGSASSEDVSGTERTLSESPSAELGELSRYAGVRRAEQMERLLSTNEFLLYHAAPEKGAPMPDKLPLRIAYKSSFGDTHHYMIRKFQGRAIEGLKPTIGPHTYYYVQTDADPAPRFSSLTAMCRYYEAYSEMAPADANYIWWKTPAKSSLNQQL